MEREGGREEEEIGGSWWRGKEGEGGREEEEIGGSWWRGREKEEE